jgi:hypothetical protein
LPFSFPIYSSSSSQKSFLISKFENFFEEINKNEKDCKETLRRYNFKRPRKQAGPSEQFSPIFISNSKEDHQRDDLQQQ